MTWFHFYAFILAPMMAGAAALGVAWWAGRQDARDAARMDRER